MELKIGRYEIVKRLADGGMAEIFLARANAVTGFKKLVVLKCMRPQLAVKREFVEMFLNEACIAATLQHPNVVQVFDVANADDNCYIVMEYVHGEDLRRVQQALIERGERLPVEETLNVAIGMCAGLHYAHEKIGYDGRPMRIVHRDVSPHNVLVTYEGGIKLVDFGVAKATTGQAETQAGVIKGKLSYMSPEQCQGKAVDRRSDIYAMGIVLYELSLGRRLYGGGSDFDILKRIIEMPVPPPSAIDPAYDRALEQIVMRALARRPEDRYQSARELQLALEELARERRVAISPITLERFMLHLFGTRAEAWREPPPAADDPYDLISMSVSLPPSPSAPSSESASSSSGRRGPRLGRAVLVSSLAAMTLAIAGWSAYRYSAHRAAAETARAGTPPITIASMVPLGAPLLRSSWLSPLAVEDSPTPAAVEVITTPPGARLMLDGQPLSVETPTTLRVPPGRHVLSIRRARHLDQTIELTVEPGARVAHTFRLERASSRRLRAGGDTGLTSEGTLILATHPWCTVAVDGVVRGPTPARLALPAGPHTIRLTNPEFSIDHTMSMDIPANETVRRRLDFPTPN